MTAPGTPRTLAAAALAAQLPAVPGGRRLEPTLRTSLRSRSSTTVTAVPVRLRRDPRGTVFADVAVDIATDGTAPAVEVAERVQQAARAVLVAHDLTPGIVDVSVLTVESPAAMLGAAASERG